MKLCNCVSFHCCFCKEKNIKEIHGCEVCFTSGLRDIRRAFRVNVSMGLLTQKTGTRPAIWAGGGHWNCIIILIRGKLQPWQQRPARSDLTGVLGKGAKLRRECKREGFLEIYVIGTHLKPLPAIKVLILLCTLRPIPLVQPPSCWAGWRSLVGKRHSIRRPPHSGQIVKWWLSTSKVSGSKGGTSTGLKTHLKKEKGYISKTHPEYLF